MVKRSRPKQHSRKFRSGKKIVVNKGIKKKVKRSRHLTRLGTFKKMTDPDRKSKKKSKFFACERLMRSQGKSKESGEKICGAIKHRKRSRGFMPFSTDPLRKQKRDERGIVLTDAQGHDFLIKVKDLKGEVKGLMNFADTPIPIKRFEAPNKFAMATNKIKDSIDELRFISEQNFKLRDDKSEVESLIERRNIDDELESNRRRARELNANILFINKEFFPDNPR